MKEILIFLVVITLLAVVEDYASIKRDQGTPGSSTSTEECDQ